jgi:hypothetical protein
MKGHVRRGSLLFAMLVALVVYGPGTTLAGALAHVEVTGPDSSATTGATDPADAQDAASEDQQLCELLATASVKNESWVDAITQLQQSAGTSDAKLRRRLKTVASERALLKIISGWCKAQYANDGVITSATFSVPIHRDYPPEERDILLNSCTANGGPPPRCMCALEKLEDRYSLEEFEAISERIVRTRQTPPELAKLIASC